MLFRSAAGSGKLADFGGLRWHNGAAVTVVVAAENYPGRPRVGDVIVGSEADGVLHAGTERRGCGTLRLIMVWECMPRKCVEQI